MTGVTSGGDPVMVHATQRKGRGRGVTSTAITGNTSDGSADVVGRLGDHSYAGSQDHGRKRIFMTSITSSRVHQRVVHGPGSESTRRLNPVTSTAARAAQQRDMVGRTSALYRHGYDVLQR